MFELIVVKNQTINENKYSSNKEERKQTHKIETKVSRKCQFTQIFLLLHGQYKILKFTLLFSNIKSTTAILFSLS